MRFLVAKHEPGTVVSQRPGLGLSTGPPDPEPQWPEDPGPVSTVTLSANASEMWEYIRPYLSKFKQCPNSGWVPELISLPRVRDMGWNEGWILKNGFRDAKAQDISTLIIQVTGERPPNPCSRCRKGDKGPYGECIVISRAADPRARSRIVGCANCVYHGQQTFCSFKFSDEQRAHDQGDTAFAPPPEAQTPNPITPGTDSAQNQWPRRSERVLLHESLSLSEVSNRRTELKHEQEVGLLSTQVHQPISKSPSASVQSAAAIQSQSSSVPVLKDVSLARPTQETDNLEMDDWEIAPGRLRSSDAVAATRTLEEAEPPENIAFSKAYLTNQSVRVSADVAFRVEVVSSGSPVRWQVGRNRMRICSVAAGKVRVRIEGENEFSIGHHGMFKVRSGKGCVVQNRLYGDAVLHVSEFACDQE